MRTDTDPDVAAVVLADRTGRIRHWNHAAERLFGYPAGEAVGRDLDLIVPEEYRERHWAGFHRAMATGQGHLDGAAANIPVRCRGGAVLAFPGRFAFLRDPYGRMVGAMAVYTPRSGDEQPFEPVAPRTE